MNKKLATALAVIIAVSTATSAQADRSSVTVGTLLTQKQEIGELELTVQKLRLELEQKELNDKIENVGKPAKSDNPEMDSTLGYPGMPEFLNPNMQKQNPDEDEERRRQERLNSVLDSAVVTSVSRDKGGDMRATITLQNGNLPVRVGRKVGNWTVDDIRLNGIAVSNEKTGEEKLIPTASEAAGL